MLEKAGGVMESWSQGVKNVASMEWPYLRDGRQIRFGQFLNFKAE